MIRKIACVNFDNSGKTQYNDRKLRSLVEVASSTVLHNRKYSKSEKTLLGLALVQKVE